MRLPGSAVAAAPQRRAWRSAADTLAAGRQEPGQQGISCSYRASGRRDRCLAVGGTGVIDEHRSVGARG